jgi:hypothetical protein
MDEPVRSRLRPARRCGLTSPDQVTAHHGRTARHATSHCPRQTLDKPHNSERQEDHTHHQPKISIPAPAGRKRSPEFTRWIEAKPGP